LPFSVDRVSGRTFDPHQTTVRLTDNGGVNHVDGIERSKLMLQGVIQWGCLVKLKIS